MLPKELPYLERFQLARNVGFEGIEIGTIGDPKEADAIKDASEKSGPPDPLGHERRALALAAVERRPRGGRARASPAWRRRSATRSCGARASCCWCPRWSTPQTGYQDAWTRSQKVIRERILPLATELKVIVGIEEVWNKFLLSPLELNKYVDEFASPWVRAYVDVGNMVFYGYPQDWIRTVGKRTVRVHLKDFQLDRPNGKFAWKNLGEGDIDWPEVRKALADVGYEGWATVEIQGGDAAYLKDVVGALRPLPRRREAGRRAGGSLTWPSRDGRPLGSARPRRSLRARRWLRSGSRLLRSRGRRGANARARRARGLHLLVLALPDREVPDREGDRARRRARLRRRRDPAPADGRRDAGLRERPEARGVPQRASRCRCCRSTRTSSHPDPAERQKHVDHTKHCLELAAQLGIPVRPAQLRALEDDQVLRRAHEGEGRRAAPCPATPTTTPSSGASTSIEACLPHRREGRRDAGAREPLGPHDAPREPAAHLPGESTRPGSASTSTPATSPATRTPGIELLAPHAVIVQAKTYYGGGEWYTLDLDYPRIAGHPAQGRLPRLGLARDGRQGRPAATAVPKSYDGPAPGLLLTPPRGAPRGAAVEGRPGKPASPPMPLPV